MEGFTSLRNFVVLSSIPFSISIFSVAVYPASVEVLKDGLDLGNRKLNLVHFKVQVQFSSVQL